MNKDNNNSNNLLNKQATSLQIVETNQFKNLTHLRLDMRAGNDAAVKRYLAGNVCVCVCVCVRMRAGNDAAVKRYLAGNDILKT